MDKATLLIFIQQILTRTTTNKTAGSLRQLQSILRQQGNTEGADIVERALRSIPEAAQVAESGILTENALRDAEIRALDRERREAEERMRHGRC